MLTYNQQILLDEIVYLYNSPLINNSTFHVNSVAGSGKSFMIKYIVDFLKIKDYLYTAYNKAIVTEGEEKHGKGRSKTFHAFAWKYTNTPNIGNFYPSNISDKMPYKDKVRIVDHIDKYYQSSYEYFDDYADENGVSELMSSICNKYIEMMFEGKIKHTFNFMLKQLHLNLLQGNIHIELDALFVDEAQDLIPVMLEIFALIDTNVTMYFGDSEQSIYAFMDLISAFEYSPKVFHMPDSFRCSPFIGSGVEEFGKNYLSPDFKFTGHNTSTSRDGSKLNIVQNNTEIINIIADYQRKGTNYSLTRDIKDIAEIPLKVEEIISEGFKGKHSNRNPKYFSFINIMSDERITHKKTEMKRIGVDDDIISAYNFIMANKDIDISVLVSNSKKYENDANNIVSTAHSAKGLEADTVYISETLQNLTVKAIASRNKGTGEFTLEAYTQLKLMYVAMTRARFKIIKN